MVTHVSSTRELAPEGMYLGICYQFIDFGTQMVKKFKSEEFEPKSKVKFGFELTGTKMTDGRPFTIRSSDLTASLYKQATLKQYVDALNGVSIPKELAGRLEMGQESYKIFLGRACQIEVKHSADGEYDNIEKIYPITQGTPIPELVNKTMFFDMDEFDKEVFLSLNNAWQEKIRKSAEWRYKGEPVMGPVVTGEPITANPVAREPSAAQKAAEAAAGLPVDDIPF